MKLVIVESPAKAETITKYLDAVPGDAEYDVTSSIGHIRDLPKSENDAIDVEDNFNAHYVIPDEKKDVVAKLKKKAKQADAIILATDPDREGEAIAWHIAQVLTKEDDIHASDFKRVSFNEITEDAIKSAFENPRDIDEDLRKAQEARRVLDRLFGYDLSGLIWEKLRYGLSAGRVQSPALRILAQREREIRDFDPDDYWVITADVTGGPNDAAFTLECEEEPDDKETTERIVAVGETNTWTVDAIKEKKRKRNPYPPFKTSTLQRAASSRFGYSPSRTMRAAQQLYEAGDITYMRTDSTTLAKEAQNQALALVDDEYGQDYIKKRNYTTDDESAQEAHEAVRPTNLSNRDAGTNSVQKKVYDLIWRQTVASQMTAAQILQTKVVVQVGDGDIPHFKINGSRTVFDGWLKVNPHARGEDTHVPELKEGQTLNLQEIHTEKKQTKPPRRYTEAGLVKELEKRGIGRPSTYANIMQKLQQRDYVNKDGKSLVPTDTGNVVSSFLEDHFTRYISDDFTARMENELDAIAAGESEYVATLEDFYTDFSDAIESKEDMDKITNLGPAPDEYDCPECDGDMIIKLGKNGKFMSCADFPDCQGARTMEGKDISEGEPLGTYSDTDTMMFKKEGPYGPYIQLGEDNEDEADPKRVSIPDDVDPDTITQEQAEKLLALPRTLGEHPDTGNEIRADIGPYGPYVAEIKDEGKPDYYSIDDEDLSVHTIDQDAALDIIKEDS